MPHLDINSINSSGVISGGRPEEEQEDKLRKKVAA